MSKKAQPQSQSEKNRNYQSEAESFNQQSSSFLALQGLNLNECNNGQFTETIVDTNKNQSLPAQKNMYKNIQLNSKSKNIDEQEQHQLKFLRLNFSKKTKPIDKTHNHQNSCQWGKSKHSQIQRQWKHSYHSQIKKKHNYQRKVQQLQFKIQQLQKQISSLRRIQQICPQCHYNLSENQFIQRERSLRNIIIPEDYYNNYQARRKDQENVAGLSKRTDSKDTNVEFEKFDFFSPLMMSQQMEEKSWVFLGTMMIAMGSKIMDFDGTISVFKVLKQSVDSLRRQVQKCEERINMDFFLGKDQMYGNDQDVEAMCMGMNFDPFFSTQNQEKIAGFQLQGVKLQSVEQHQLFYDQKIKFHVKYQALITVMEYLRNHCSIQ